MLEEVQLDYTKVQTGLYAPILEKFQEGDISWIYRDMEMYLITSQYEFSRLHRHLPDIKRYLRSGPSKPFKCYKDGLAIACNVDNRLNRIDDVTYVVNAVTVLRDISRTLVGHYILGSYMEKNQTLTVQFTRKSPAIRFGTCELQYTR